MKAFSTLFIAAGLAAIAWFHSGGDALQPGAPSAANSPVRPEILTFGGRITQHTQGGLIVHCDDFIRALPPGYELSDIQGDFLLLGLPTANDTADGTRITFTARHSNLATFGTVFGSTRTIRKIVYAGSAGDVSPARGSRVSYMQSIGGGGAAGPAPLPRTALDRKPYR